MAEVDPKVMERINELAKRRLAANDRREARIKKFTDAEAALKEDLERDLLEEDIEIDALDAELYSIIEEHRSSLIKRGRQSFSTIVAKFRFHRNGSKPIIINAARLMGIARRHGHVRNIAKPPSSREWKLVQSKFFAFLQEKPEVEALYESVLGQTQETETLSMQPNVAYLKVHGKDRISPPSIPIQKKG